MSLSHAHIGEWSGRTRGGYKEYCRAVDCSNPPSMDPPTMEPPTMDHAMDPAMPTMDQDPAMDPPMDHAPLRITTDILTRAHDHAPDSPTTTLITTLRDELLTLTDHAAVLNAKLLASLDRAATLEDDVYQHTAAERRKDEQILQLERAKAQWEESMRTGLLVERKVVKDEMQRLVEGLVEEERRRGSAEEGRARVEREVDDLSATLFEQVRRSLHPRLPPPAARR